MYRFKVSYSKKYRLRESVTSEPSVFELPTQIKQEETNLFY